MSKILGKIFSNTVTDPWRKYEKKKPRWRVWRKKKKYPAPVKEKPDDTVKVKLKRNLDRVEREEEMSEKAKRKDRLERGNSRYGGQHD